MTEKTGPRKIRICLKTWILCDSVCDPNIFRYISTPTYRLSNTKRPMVLACVLNSQLKKGSNGYKWGTADLYPHQTKTSFSFLPIRPRFVGLAARPRAATLQSKAGGRCAPRLATAVLGLAARGRPAAPVRSRYARPPTKRGRRTRVQNHVQQASTCRVLTGSPAGVLAGSDPTAEDRQCRAHGFAQ